MYPYILNSSFFGVLFPVKRTQKFTLFHILGYFVLLQKLYVVFYRFILPISYPKIFYFCYFGVHHHNIPLFTHLLWLKLSLFNSCVVFFSIFFLSYATTFEHNKNCCCFSFSRQKKPPTPFSVRSFLLTSILPRHNTS